MGVCYGNFPYLLNERKITTREPERYACYSGNITTRMRRNEYISRESIGGTCQILDCKVDDILELEKLKWV